jgi:hypothetical protein
MSPVLGSTGYGVDPPKLIQYQAFLFFARSTLVSTSVAPARKSLYCRCFSFASQCCRCERAEIIAEGLQKSKTRPPRSPPRTAARFVRRIPPSSVTLRLTRCQSNHCAGCSGANQKEFKKTI